MLDKEYIQQLKKIVEEELGVKLNDFEASNIANGLVGYFDTLARLYHQDKTSIDNASKNNPQGNI